jgi:hypothetical protein
MVTVSDNRRCVASVINTHRAQRSFGDGLIADEVKALPG